MVVVEVVVVAVVIVVVGPATRRTPAHVARGRDLLDGGREKGDGGKQEGEVVVAVLVPVVLVGMAWVAAAVAVVAVKFVVVIAGVAAAVVVVVGQLEWEIGVEVAEQQ